MASRTFNKPIAKADKWKRTCDGIVYDSIIEAKRASELDIIARDGEIVGWVRQVPCQLGADTTTRVDFVVFDCGSVATGPLIYAEEVKHKRFDTKEFRRIRKLWAQYGPFRMKILWWTGSAWDIEWLEAGTETEHGM